MYISHDLSNHHNSRCGTGRKMLQGKYLNIMDTALVNILVLHEIPIPVG